MRGRLKNSESTLDLVPKDIHNPQATLEIIKCLFGRSFGSLKFHLSCGKTYIKDEKHIKKQKTISKGITHTPIETNPKYKEIIINCFSVVMIDD